ncbi:HAD-like protein [Trichoderma asperelloides]|nr:HAD-like protein [Trichoderma asperelloides]
MSSPVGNFSSTPHVNASIRSPRMATDNAEDRHKVRPTVLMMELGGVFYSLPDIESAPIPSHIWKQLVDSQEWHDLESSKLSAPEVFKALTERFGLAEGALEEMICLSQTGFVGNEKLVAGIKELKQNHPDSIVVLASNICQVLYDTIREKVDSWDIFDHVFTSTSLGARKPECAFYDRVLESVGVAAESIVFVDDRPENVIAAQCCGMHGVVFGGTAEALGRLYAMFGSPAQRGKSWLRAHAKKMWSVSNTGVEIQEQFQQLLLLHVTDDWDLVHIGQLNPSNGRWNVFPYGPPVLTTDTYPDDVDTTALALLKLDVPDAVKHKTMDDILENRNSDGLVYCYFDSTRPRIDPFISANVLRLFYANGRGDELTAIRQFVEDMLRTTAFEHATRYYHLPDFFLYYVSDLCANNPAAGELDLIRKLLCLRLQDRMGSSRDSPSAAFRLIASNNMNLVNERDKAILLDSQHEDGRWTGWLYRYGSSGILIGSDGLTTALAVNALEGVK